MRRKFIRVREGHQSEAPVIGEDDARAFIGFRTRRDRALPSPLAVIRCVVMKLARLDRCMGPVNGHAPGHAQMHDQRLAIVEMRQQIFLPAAKASQTRRPVRPGREVFPGNGMAQIGAFCVKRARERCGLPSAGHEA